MVNSYFNFNGSGNTNEQTLYKNIQNEMVNMFGFDAYYLPRQFSASKDLVFGEDVLSSFSTYYTVTFYLENATQFDGQNDMFSKFGLRVDDQISLLISAHTFASATTITTNPKANDLVYFPFNKQLFEIFNVELEKPSFYWTGIPGMHRLQCRTYEWSGEKFTTGQVDMDKFDNYTSTSKGGEQTVIATQGSSYIDTTDSNPFGNP